MASGGFSKKYKTDTHLLINEAAERDAPELSSPDVNNVSTKNNPFNYNNLGAISEAKRAPEMKVSYVPTGDSGGNGEASLDISKDDGVHGTNSRWSLFGGAVSESSWTPSAVRVRIKNWPAWMNIKTFVTAISFLITVHGALSSGYVMSIITTIEKRFEIRSKTSGLVVSSYEFGSLISVLFVSYFGSQGHIPRWIGIGGIILACGSFLWSVPHFVSAPPTSTNSTEGEQHLDLCHSASEFNSDLGAFMTPQTMCRPTADTGGSASQYVFVLILAQIFIGVGGSPLFTLGTTYIDNHVAKENSSVYLAFMYVFLAFGPVCGFLLGALMLSQYVDPSTALPAGVTHDSPSWIGLWWGGFILCGILYFLSALPFYGFPSKLPSANVVQQAAAAAEGYGKSLRKIPLSVFRLLNNSVYMVASLNACMDLAIVSGFTVFLPKYLETQFGVSKSKASVLTGGVAVPGACIGIFLGGFIMKRYKLQLKGIATLVAVVNLICLLGLTLFFFIGCDNLRLAGVFGGYDKALSIPNPLKKATVNLTNQCNSACGCSPKEYIPVCGADNRTYFSPCFAGCRAYDSDRTHEHGILGRPVLVEKVTKYMDCSCIPSPDQPMTSTMMYLNESGQPVEFSGQARSGACEKNCKMLVPFLICLFLLTLVAANNQMPLVMVTLRAVCDEEKAFALGVQVVLLRLLAYIPAPVVFGSVIDTTCLVWKQSACGEDSSTCLLYDIRLFRLRYGSIALVLKVAAAALSAALWWRIKRRCRGAEPFSAPISMSEIAHRLGDVDNLHLRPGCPSAGMRHWMSDDSLYSRPRSPRRHQKTMSC